MFLPDWDLGLTADHVLRGQGADPAVVRFRRPALVETAEWALTEGVPLLAPMVWARELAVEGVRHDRIRLEKDASLHGPLVSQHLAGAERIAVILVTIGRSLEEITAQVLRTDPLQGLALDGLGTAAVETLAAKACSFFEERARADGLETSIPLSPGMVGWPVDPGQRQVFALLEPESIDVRLNSSFMMTPNKSLTQVLGFGKEMGFKGRTCDFCSLKETCRYQDHYQSKTT